MPYPSVVMPPTVVAVPAALPPWIGGGGSSGGFQHNQTTPSASWSIPHSLGRLPNVQIYISGAVVIADVAATASLVTVVFPSATSGVAVLV